MEGARELEIIYLTGPPASGKSTLVALLQEKIERLLAFSYSDALADYVSRRDERTLTRRDVRKKSASVVSPEDIEAVDASLSEFVDRHRRSSHIIIDSHAVTKESYGFRVTPFSLGKLGDIRPTRIVALYTEPQVVVDRIQSAPDGRPAISQFEAICHCSLQCGVALVYGVDLGIPIHFYEADSLPGELVDQVAKLFGSRR